ncbi:MAG: cell division ATP-binding protein FtsE [Ignavibacteriales bacterium]|nr:cell division ATP-binding protein FtsE [Ignavibacteriales bacterium]
MIHFENVFVAYNSQPILTNVSLEIKPGDFVSLVGESGVGKTTLLKLIYFDLPPDEGNVSIAGFTSSTIKKKEIPKIRRQIGVVFQDYKLLDDKNVYDNVAFALHVTGVKRNEIGKRVLRVLADVGLSHKRDSMPEELSGGEQQRVVFARAMVNDPIVLLADEPTGNLDPATALDILQLMKTINSRGTAVILSTHNYELVRKAGGRIIQIKDGKVSEIESI